MPDQVFSFLRKQLNVKTGKAFTLGTIFLIVISGVLFYLYISHNYTYLVERNFRLLATWSKELSETYQNNLQSIQFRLTEIQTDKRQLLTSRSVEGRFLAKGPILQDFEDITTQRLYFEDKPSTQHSKVPPLGHNAIQEKLGKLPYIHIEQSPQASQKSGLQAQLSLGLPLETDTPAPPETPEKDKASDRGLTASFDLDQLVKAVVTEPVFDDVLLVDPTGLVVYQKNPSSFRFFHLRNLLHNQRVESAWWDEILGKNGMDAKKVPDDTDLTKAIQTIVPAHFQVTLGGTDYEMFMQAVVFPPSSLLQSESIAHPTPWIVCGLLPTSTFRDQYLAIPFTVLLLFIFLLVSAFLTLPFLSLVLMNPRERLSRFSVGTLLFTHILGAGVVTFFVLDLTFYQQTTSFLNERLQALADSTQKTFQLQLDRLLWQLNTFDKKIEDLQDLQRLSNSHDSKAWLARVALSDPCLETQQTGPPLCFPDFSVAFWTDRKGMLRETWSRGDTPYVQGVHDLSHREYVSTILEHDSPLYRRHIHNQWIDFYVQPLITLENSERSFVVSMPHGTSRYDSHSVPQWIAAIQTEELGLLKPAVLAPGSGMAVIDNQTGRVLFHTDPHRMLRENFIEETDDNAELGALIHARAAGGFEGKYWGIGHYFYAQPVEGLPWTLVVFRSKELFRTINFEILMFSSSLFTIYIFGLLLWLKMLFVLYRFNAEEKVVRWLWPRPSACPVYERLSVFLVGLNILGIFFMVWIDWQWGTASQFAILTMLLPLLGIWYTVRTLWHSAEKEVIPPEPVSANSRRVRGSYARLGLAGFFLLGVMPVTLFFKLAHDEEMRLFVQQQMWGFAQSLEQHSQSLWRQVGTGATRQDFHYVTDARPCLIPGCRMDAQMPDIPPDTDCQPSATPVGIPALQYLLQGLYVDLSFPVCLSFESEQTDAGSPRTGTWLQTLHQVVRKSSLQNPMNQESWGFIEPYDQSSAGRWSRRIEGNHQIIDLQLPQVRAQDRVLHVQADAPLFPWNIVPLMIGMLLIGAFLCTLAYHLFRYVIVRIYPMPVSPSHGCEPMSRELKKGHPSLQNVFILGSPGCGKSTLIKTFSHEWDIFDLHTIRGKTDWAENSLTQMVVHSRAVVVDHFEYQWENPAQNEQKRLFVEGLLLRNLQVCIMSSRNPYDWETRPSQDSVPPSSHSPQGSWIDHFHTFGLVYFLPHNMEDMIRRWLNPQARSKKREQTEDTDEWLVGTRWLTRETEGTVHLQRIGNWIRSFPDWPQWSSEDLKEQVRIAAFPYYRFLWESCSIPEKLALYHVAIDGFLHTHNPELVTLSQKGLLRFGPELQMLNESFRSFVMDIAGNTRLAEWEEGATSDTWARLKYPFLLVFGVIVLFLFATQQEFKSSFITLLSLLPVLLPALPEIPLLLTGQKGTRSTAP